MRFLGGYSIFLAPLVGIYITDYFVVRRGNVWVVDLYRAEKGARYYYMFGLNWRNAVAFTVTVVFLVPGFAAQFGHKVGSGWVHLYSLGWVVGCAMSSVVYFGLAMVGGFCEEERGMRFEESYERQAMFCEGLVEGLNVEIAQKQDVGMGGEQKGVSEESKVVEV